MAVILFYMFAALVMVFVNKAVLNSSPDLTLTFLFLQLVLAVILLHVANLFTSSVEIPHWDWYTVKKLTPLIAVGIVALVFNTLCLQEVETTFFQIARSLVLPLTIAITPVKYHPRQATRITLAAGLVTIGFVIGVIPEGSLPLSSIPSSRSVLFGVFSSLCTAVHSVLVKSALSYCNNSTTQLAYWTNAGSAILLAPIVLLHGEPAKIVELCTSSEWNMHIFVVGILVTGSVGFCLSIAGLLSIKVTSPITHMFSSAVRSVVQTLLGVWLFGDVLTPNRTISLATILGGTIYYTWVKATDHARPPPLPVDIEAHKQVNEKANEKMID
jgi:GDP-fucose transporter C1